MSVSGLGLGFYPWSLHNYNFRICPVLGKMFLDFVMVLKHVHCATSGLIIACLFFFYAKSVLIFRAFGVP